jgi:hypothetical protein
MRLNRSILFSVSFLTSAILAGVCNAQVTEDVSAAEAFVGANEAAVQQMKPFERFRLLQELAPAAFQAGDPRKGRAICANA